MKSKTFNKGIRQVILSSLLMLSFWGYSQERDSLKISLAEWSLHRSIESGKVSNLDFPRIAREQFNLDAIEYVNQFFENKAGDLKYLQSMKDSCAKYRVNGLLIMVDGEGNLSSLNPNEQLKAIESHKKWVDAAKFLGCHSIRVNLHGDGTEEEWVKASIKGLKPLVDYGARRQINIIVENHGQWSSKGELIVRIMKSIDSPWCGTLPDFGNFCVRRRDGDMWSSPCVEYYDPYLGVDEMMPFARGVSAKTRQFDMKGNESEIDYIKMLHIVSKHNYHGYLGIEYEGEDPDEVLGIQKSISLLRTTWTNLSKE